MKDTTIDCLKDLISDLEHYSQWINNEEHCKEELKWLRGWSERIFIELKAFEIIKDRNVDILELRICMDKASMGVIPDALKEYNEFHTLNDGMKLTFEEYEILKGEVE